ncbi:MAG: hypothetical protein AUI10_06420 [Actinobacteria bacterium 13_2_20CM_2_72_6]|nr:MAG: hypothetical protein AUI10_06420 [Actinobacteria bacterium 13_2_20CM_2_72_6]
MTGDQWRSEFESRWERLSPDRRGKIVIVLWCHATAVVLIDGALAGYLAVSAVRIWRRREQGWVRAVAGGGRWRTIAALTVASAVQQAIGRSAVKRLVTRD